MGVRLHVRLLPDSLAHRHGSGGTSLIRRSLSRFDRLILMGQIFALIPCIIMSIWNVPLGAKYFACERNPDPLLPLGSHR
jgi:hypothetical protein